jgi:hypothetical protein
MAVFTLAFRRPCPLRSCLCPVRTTTLFRRLGFFSFFPSFALGPPCLSSWRPFRPSRSLIRMHGSARR